jgi:putative DNA-invertase from lambdoid prophage Rac
MTSTNIDRTPKAAVTYHRVSTRDQNPQLAREELRAAATLRRLHLLEEVEETGSGARNDRPGLQRVMELVRGGRVSCVLCWKLDRIGRSALDVLANVRAMTDTGVTFICTSQGIEVGPAGGPMGNLVLTLLAAIAEFEREIICERTRLGHAAARRAGKHIGRPRSLAPGDIARAVAMRIAGASWATIAKTMPTVATRHKGKDRVGQLTRGAVERAVRGAMSETGVSFTANQSRGNAPRSGVAS